MGSNRLAEVLNGGRIALGLGNMYPASGIIEGMCKEWDFVWIDSQHGQFTYEGMLQAMQAAGAIGIETLVRVPGHEYGTLGRAADLAPSAIMVPMVNCAEEARAIVKALRYAPLGGRSYGGRRAVDLYGRTYYKDRELLVIAQIETLEGAEAADEIIGTPGIDCLFFGPDDMKVQMGLPINTAVFDNERLLEVMRRIAGAAKAAGKHAGCITASPEALQAAVGMGYRLLVGGGDVVFLRTAAAARLEELKAALAACEGAANAGA